MEKPRYIPFITTSVAEDLCLAILLIPLWWILGIKFFIFHFIALFVLIKLLVEKKRQSEKIRFSTEISILLAFVSLYFFSLLINFKNIPIWRLFASLNNLSLWVMGLLIIFIMYNSITKKDVPPLLRTFRNFGIISSIFAISTLILSIILHKFLRVKTLLFMLLPEQYTEAIRNNALILKSSLHPSIIVPTGFFKIKRIPRPEGFNVYATALAGTMLLLIAMTLAYYKIKNKKRKTGFVVVLILEFLTLFISMSRNPILGIFLALFIVYVITNIRESLSLKILSLALIIIIAFLIFFPHNKVTNTFIGIRKISTLWRFDLYKTTFLEATKKPFFGYGFKPRRMEDSPVPLPVASHSMYFGILYKTGFLGLIAFFLFWISVLRRWAVQMNPLREDRVLKYVWFYSGVALIGGLLWMVTEDLDAPPIVAFLYFIIIGLIVSLNRLKKSPAEK